MRLADFGLASLMKLPSTELSLTRAGALRWMAREILEADQRGLPVHHTPESDIFSFAMCILHVRLVTLLRLLSSDSKML